MIVANWIGVDMGGAPTGPVVWALLQSEFYQRGIKDRVKNESIALKSLVGDLQTKLTEFQEEERKQVVKFNETHGGLVTQSTVQQEAFEKAQTGRKDSWDTQVDAAETELKRIKDTYDNFMSLAAPVMYWKSKQRRHRWWMGISGALVVASMLLVGKYLHSEIDSIGKAATVQKAATEAKALRIEAKPSTPVASASAPASSNGTLVPKIEEAVEIAATWRLGSFIVLATLCFWFLRLLVRVFLSNMHLENDAAERVTMAQTYLALLRKGRLPEKEDISMVLAALFRPSGDGLVKDEGVPPSFLEMLTKLGSK